MKHHFNPKDGNLNLERPKEFREAIKDLPECRHVLEIKKFSPKRSNGANAYYWKIVIRYFMDEMGLPKSESSKDYMHYDVLGRELRQVPDENRPGQTKTRRTRDMTGSEFWKYIHQCQLLFQDMYHGSFPPPKSLGYDTGER